MYLEDVGHVQTVSYTPLAFSQGVPGATIRFAVPWT